MDHASVWITAFNTEKSTKEMQSSYATIFIDKRNQEMTQRIDVYIGSADIGDFECFGQTETL